MAKLPSIRPSLTEVPIEAQRLVISVRRRERRISKKPPTKAKAKRKTENKQLRAVLKDPKKARELLEYLIKIKKEKDNERKV